MRTTNSRWLAASTGIVAAGMLITLGRAGAFVSGLICGTIIGAAMMWVDRAAEREDAFNRGFTFDGPEDPESSDLSVRSRAAFARNSGYPDLGTEVVGSGGESPR